MINTLSLFLIYCQEINTIKFR